MTPEEYRRMHGADNPAFETMSVEEFRKGNFLAKEKKNPNQNPENEMLLRELEAYLKAKYTEVEKEYRFDVKRKYRFDFCLLNQRIALEIEGGLWVTSRHRTGSGYQEDMRKYNLAASLGWWVFRFSYKDLQQKEYEKYI